MNRHRDTHRVSPTLILLIAQIYQNLERLPIKPPVTIALLAINILTHIHPYVNIFGYDLSSIQQNCIHPQKIITLFHRSHYDQILSRLTLASIIHIDDMHLYYNMISLCWKGIQLELQMGSYAFGYLIAYCILASHSIMVFMSYFLYHFVQVADQRSSDISGYNSCAVGFSAVLFALKYVLNHNSPSYTHVMGISVPLKYAAWLEVIVVSILNPNVSFMGHLAGILAGVIYVHGIEIFIRKHGNTNTNANYQRQDGSRGSRSSGTSYTYARGTVS